MTNALPSYLRHEAMTNGLSNVLFNGVIAWWLLQGQAPREWLGAHSFLIDILATAFVLPFIVALIVIPLQRRKQRKGLTPEVNTLNCHPWFLWALSLPKSLFLTATIISSLSMAALGSLTLMLLWLAGIETISVCIYSIFKGVWAGLLAAIVVLPMILYALSASGQAAATPRTQDI